ncbi:uncharacterized protein CYBJADRAFT_11148 [Cyberlindnera jadinii NRRL Y-1542]|uniref:Uncharacterized protein n=1 Tax=Cyberlindnera jadinii (strain ATCC 18201 / CBS 1600 / BCRC 20928 / JCM 3617 / NBRC 0987 / NRRL Y-1542) TaxID=983966 RepID=A0A1E4SA13_CYBJN|nr:hypothetical protein CYBJADRAFT_11148 [Cyberlindnera jadinii NRRL Y-1542]ODV76349.1 hypothetical protein CYBJADRAFT_11148 [Cyberlindnera jadinii NRRL Y-1542]
MCPFVLEFSFSAFGVWSLENQNTLFFPLVVPTFQCALGCAALEWAEPTVGGFSQVEGGYGEVKIIHTATKTIAKNVKVGVINRFLSSMYVSPFL